MIVPMKKLTLVVMEKEKVSALGELRHLGLVHLEERPVHSEKLSGLIDRKAKAQTALGLLENSMSPKELSKLEPSGTKDAPALVAEVYALTDEKKACYEANSSDYKEIARVDEWGDFNPSDLRSLSDCGVELVPFRIPLKRSSPIDPAQPLIALGKSKTHSRFFAIGKPLYETPQTLGGEMPFVLPERSISRMREDIEGRLTRIAEIEKKLQSLAPFKSSIADELTKLASEIEFEAARGSMEGTADSPEGLGVCWIQGFVPGEDAGHIKRSAMDQGWAILIDDPRDDELPPTKVKNSFLVSSIQPVLDFLGTVPNYREYDISLWFLVFFCFFFAMIFGDGGYGSILLLTSLFMLFKDKKAKRPVGPFTRLLVMLSSFTVFWGAMTMSWFGLPPDKLPSFFHAIDLFPISNANPDSGDNVKVLCFYLGMIQLVIAHAKNIKRDIRSPRVLSQLGQMLMVVGMMSLVLLMVVDAERFPLPVYAPYLIGGGFALHFLFAGYVEGHGIFFGVGKSILSSLANSVSMFLGVVNVFADIVSYIRLWAVGLAGVAISQTVNGMVDSLFAKPALIVLGLLLLVFGHGLNMILSVLSVIVHGVRLNMLEFSGHLGMEWSGYSYNPFREKEPVKEGSDNSKDSSKELS